jgi:hypothetical protein
MQCTTLQLIKEFWNLTDSNLEKDEKKKLLTMRDQDLWTALQYSTKSHLSDVFFLCERFL